MAALQVVPSTLAHCPQADLLGGGKVNFDPLSDLQLHDAPAGHAAWEKVKFQAHAQGHLYFFKRNFHFQVTLGMACNLDSEAGRICRLCFYLAEERHATKEQLVEFRNRLLNAVAAEERRRRVEEGLSPTSAEPRKLQMPASGKTDAPLKKRRTGAIGSSWASQLGSKHSKMRSSVDLLDDSFF
mmetsp:Transcript_126569/g.405139  ORF Transcript_126569/g.405139 Transcript_126569/m.405139 type:complete len:184 (+) Transcript_126569:166-717(+)